MADTDSLRLSKYLKYVKHVNVFYYVVEAGGTNAQVEYSTGQNTVQPQ